MRFMNKFNSLKRHDQAKIIKKSVFVFRFLNMAIRYEHVHEKDLRRYFTFWAAVAMEQVCRKPHLSVIPVFLILDMHVRKLISYLFLA